MSIDWLASGFDPNALAVLVPVAFVANFVFATLGFGGGVVGTPLAAQFLEPRFVLAVFALLECVITLRLLSIGAGHVVIVEARRLIPTCIAGVVIGSSLLVRLPVPAIMIAMGIFVFGFTLYRIAAPKLAATVSPRWGPVAGAAGGLASALFGAGGPPYAIYLSMRPLSVPQMRSTLAATGVVSVGSRVAAFAFAGLFDHPRVWASFIVLLPVMGLAMLAADRLQARISRRIMLAAINALLAIAGVLLIVRGALAG